MKCLPFATSSREGACSGALITGTLSIFQSRLQTQFLQ